MAMDGKVIRNTIAPHGLDALCGHGDRDRPRQGLRPPPLRGRHGRRHNVAGKAALAGQTFTPVTRTLLTDLSSLNLPCGVADFAGLTWGPTLANGDRSLVLVSDNGFDAHTATRVLAVLGRLPLSHRRSLPRHRSGSAA